VSRYPFAVQAAEYFLRSETNALGLDELRLSGYQRGPEDELTARFGLSDGREAEVVVRTSLGAERFRLTCDASNENPIPAYDLVSCSIE
jgi:hypothetical protein